MTTPGVHDLYQVLGVAPNADGSELDHAFRVRARRLHPDMQTPDADNDAFRQLVYAYAVLRDPIARSSYDNDRAASTASVHPATAEPRADRATTSGSMRFPAEPALRIGPVRWRPSPEQARP